MNNESSGTVVISLDAELAWGYHDRHPLSPEEQRRVANARQSWERLVDLFDEYDIPATWAVVGELLIDDERLRTNHPHTESWFETHRREAPKRPSEWFAADIVQKLLDGDPDHEIASHSFSHVPFSETTADVAEVECRYAHTAAAEYDVELTSFVFPRNEIEHRRALAESGYTCYRGRRPHRLPSVPGLRGLATLVGAMTSTPAPPTVTPHIDEYGLVELPASLFIGGFRGEPWSSVSRLVGDTTVRLVKFGVEKAHQKSEILHLWLHPNDLVEPADVRRMESILSYLADERDRRELSIETMNDVARRVLETSSTERVTPEIQL